MAGLNRAFTDPALEAAFQAESRRRRIPFVRAYAIVFGLVVLLYAAANPLFFAAEGEVRFTLLLVPTILCLGGYFGLTFWRFYVDSPLIDFAFLLMLAMLVTADNVVLLGEVARVGTPERANMAINGLIVGAFAAFALAGRWRWFCTWVGLHAFGFVNLQLILEPGTEARFYACLSHLTGAAVMLFLSAALGRSYRLAFLLQQDLEQERAKTEELLYNVLPEGAAKRLREGRIVADAYSDATVVFIDVVGFTRLAATVSPGHLIEMLNAFFGMADAQAAEHGIEKVKTIGDAYLAVSGGNMPAANSADAAIAFAEAVIAGLDEVREETGLPVHVRIGIHSGPVVGGVIGATRMAYDYWGETMNMASRIESHARPDGIALSESAYLRSKRKAAFEDADTVTLKGVGDAPIFRSRPQEPVRLALAG